MNTGFGFSEILMVVVLVVVFFGSKELPAFLREIARFTAKVRRYSDKIKRELDDITRSADPQPVPFAEQQEKKKKLRAQCIDVRRNLGADARAGKSAAITRTVLECAPVRDSVMIMLYAEMGAEVITRPLAGELIGRGKRVMLPYGIEGDSDLRFAEVFDTERDILPGKHGVPEPREGLRKDFFRSDLQVIICPGVAFDRQGGRLGRGKGYYDRFLRELRGKVPFIGLAFDCQILAETLPFEYHDIPMDMVITESGIIVGAPEAGNRENSLQG